MRWCCDRESLSVRVQSERKVRARCLLLFVFLTSQHPHTERTESREMSGKIILSREETSVRFHDKVLVLSEGQTVKVSRSSSDDKPDTCNAVFDCRVGLLSPLSSPQDLLVLNILIFISPFRFYPSTRPRSPSERASFTWRMSGAATELSSTTFVSVNLGERVMRLRSTLRMFSGTKVYSANL